MAYFDETGNEMDRVTVASWIHISCSGYNPDLPKYQGSWNTENDAAILLDMLHAQNVLLCSHLGTASIKRRINYHALSLCGQFAA